MLYKFKSAETSDVLMLEPHGRRLLEIIGKTPGPTGIVLPEQMPAAITALRAAIEQEEVLKAERAEAEAASTEAVEESEAEMPDADQGQRSGQPGLRQRAAPFIDMLKRSHQAGVQVVWGV